MPVRVTVKISGTVGGFRKFCRGETDVQDASRPILTEEMEVCTKAGVKYLELPIAFDALTVAVSPAATWVRSMTVAELRTMWEPAAQGKVTRWSQIRPGWPDAPFKLYGADTDSGTFDYFTEAVVGQGQGEPNRLCPPARTTMSSCKASPATRTRSGTSPTRTSSPTRES